eukprot:NODE_17307_length_950_cov_6.518834.p1 GENE.NODE_17307_length_950_cov_6.518834~~NODE_17307_length_950_cov_6.518834.p1  ORF type:complete len:283 (-),score=74.22 NODE_17307_length_950_cov_6.518834:101-844(-)
MPQRLTLFLLLLSALSCSVEGTAQGALKLDNYTFDKMMAMSGHSFLVKFDKSYPYGEKEDEFKVLCKLAHALPQFFVAEVPVQEYGDRENSELAERFGFTEASYPAYLLFDDQRKDGEKYSGVVKADDIAAWLRARNINMASIGTIAELDELVKRFFASGMPVAEADAARSLANGYYKGDHKAPMYVKILERLQSKGISYIEDERARVTKLIAGKVTPAKKEELQDKLKVLAVFAEHAERADQEDEL